MLLKSARWHYYTISAQYRAKSYLFSGESSIVTNEARQPLCTAVISGDFDSTEAIVDKTLVLLRAIFAVQEIQSAQVIVVKASLGPRESDKLLSLAATRMEFDFLQQKTDGMDTEYKMIQLGAHIRRYLLPESQIL